MEQNSTNAFGSNTADVTLASTKDIHKKTIFEEMRKKFCFAYLESRSAMISIGYFPNST